MPSGWNKTVTAVGTFFMGSGELPPTMGVSSSNGTIEAAAERAKHLQSRLLNYKLVSEENTTVAGRQRLSGFTSGRMPRISINFTQVQTWLQSGEKLYTITATSLTENYRKYEPIFERMISSFRFSS